MLKESFKVLAIQLAIFLVHQSAMYYFVRVLHLKQFAIIEMPLIIFHWVILVVLMCSCFYQRKTGHAIGYLLSFIIILVIGFGTCATIVWR
jgi:hypothetical protein